jgi:hypothetical protein
MSKVLGGLLLGTLVLCWFLFGQIDKYRTLYTDEQKALAVVSATLSERSKQQARVIEIRTHTREVQFKTIREKIDAQPETYECARSPSIRAALDGLRNNPEGVLPLDPPADRLPTGANPSLGPVQ